jgi:hypothetical protein
MARDKLTLDFLEPPQREYLRKQAEKRKCSVAEVVRALVDSDIENNRQGAREPDPLDEIVGVLGDEREKIMRLAGMISDDEVSGENFHDYLYGEDHED